MHYSRAFLSLLILTSVACRSPQQKFAVDRDNLATISEVLPLIAVEPWLPINNVELFDLRSNHIFYRTTVQHSTDQGEANTVATATELARRWILTHFGTPSHQSTFMESAANLSHGGGE